MSRTSEVAEPRKMVSRLPLALCLAIIITLVLTCVSVTAYYVAGFYKFDLSRPGYESQRDDVTTNATSATYDTTSPINHEALSQFLAEHDKNVQDLSLYGNFGDHAALDDHALSLEP